MGIDVHLETEDGKRLDSILDPKGIIARLIPIDDERFPVLRYVDLYGNTVFNRAQSTEVLRELELLEKHLNPTTETSNCISQLKELARKCEAEPHLYLKFVGD